MLRIILVFIGCCIWASHAAYTLEEYNGRQKIVKEMNELYQDLINIPIHEDERRINNQDNFTHYCKSKFENTHVWIISALEDPKVSLVEPQLKLNKFNIEKTDMFIKTALDTAQTATRMGFWCSAVMQNKSEATHLVEFQKSIETKIPALTKSLKAQMQSVFKKNVKTLVDSLLANRTFDYDSQTQTFMTNAAATLRKDFPVGQWVTVAFASFEAKRLCTRPGTFSITTRTTAYWTFIVYLVKDGQNSDPQAVADALGRIKGEKKEYLCPEEMDEIMKEANYRCNSDQFTFFGVLEKAVFGASDINLFRQKDIKRDAIIWPCSLKIGILA